jgi:hypothetical protein
MFLEISLKDVLAYIGAISVFLGFIKLLFDIVPKLNSLKSTVYKFFATRLKHRTLEKRAIASNIEEVVNNSVLFLKNELPKGWINKAKIDWVREEPPEALEEGELIIRLKPFDDQDQNLMNGIYYFFTKVLFPGIKDVIPALPRRAAVLQLSKRTISKNHPYIMTEFEKRYLDSAISVEEDIAYYLGHYDNMDSRGYFTGVFIREVADMATRLRYSHLRPKITNELREITNHISNFSLDFPHHTEGQWYRKNDLSSYGFLLVAKPVQWRRVDTYVNKAHNFANNGIERLYVLGADQEKTFVQSVINAIVNRTEYHLSDILEQNLDYRGERGGICAIFTLTSTTKEIIQEITSVQNQQN